MRILVSACEVSGDAIGSRLADPLREVFAGADLRGATGPKSREAGIRSLAAAEDFSHVGWASVLASLPALVWKLWRYSRAVDRMGAQAAVLVDAPGVHGPLLGRLHRRGVPVVWVAPPQLWAWRDRPWRGPSGIRVHPLHRFELPALLHQGLDARWVGFPGGERLEPNPVQDLLAVLPGSRPHWRRAHRELFLEAVERAHLPLTPVLVHPAPPRPLEDSVPCLTPREAFPRAALALSIPGTGSLELARAGVPTVLAAKPGWLDARMALARLDPGPKGLPNRILDSPVFPERFSPHLSAGELVDLLLRSWERRSETRRLLEPLEDRLGAQGSERRIALSVAEIVRGG